MTLLPKKRGMPNLCLQVKPSAKARGEISFIARLTWDRVCVLLFLFFLVPSQLFTTSLFAQDLRNRTEEMHHLGTVIISSESLPDKVYQAQKNKFIISVIFFEKDTDKIITSSVGTGFISHRPGVVITARHLLVEAIREVNAIKTERIKSNPKFDYSYAFMGTIITSDQWLNFPLFLVATGEVGTMKDIMALRADVVTMEQARNLGELVIQNPLRMLLKTTEFADAKLGEKVYITGFAPIETEYTDKNNKTSSVYIDFINYTFSAEVELLIYDMPVNRAGVRTLYRLRDSAEPGFSGGKVINGQGQVVGMTMASSPSRNFIYAISSKDIKAFLKDNKLE